MLNQAQNKRAFWILAGLWTALLYLGIPFARTIQNALQAACGSRELFRPVAGVLLGTAFVAAAIHIARRHGPAAWRPLLWLAGTGAVYGYCMLKWTVLSVEALHFVEYGILGVLLYRAFRHHIPDDLVHVAATLVGAIIGLVDEVLQWLTPERVWDIRDVAINVMSVALVQVAIARGLAPVAPKSGFAMTSVRTVCRLGAVLALLLALCSANTPPVTEWLGRHVPGLGLLRNKEAAMTEYGHLYSDPAIGVFRSRFTLEELSRLDRQRGKDAAAILDLWKRHDLYPAFLKVYTPAKNPFVHEVRVHLFRRDHYLGMLWPRDWNAAMNPELTAEKQAACAAIVLGETRILLRYFPNTMLQSSCGLPPVLMAALIAHADTTRPYESTVGRHLITWTGPGFLAGSLLILAVLLAAVARLSVAGNKAEAMD